MVFNLAEELESSAPIVPPNALGEVSTLAQRLVDLQKEKERMEAQLQEVDKQIEQVGDFDLPDALTKVGLSEIKLTDGTKVFVKPLYFPSVSKENAERAFAWMRENGYGGLIKHSVNFDFGKGGEESEEYHQLKAAAESIGLEPQDVRAIHPQTFKAWAKEMVESGKSLPDAISLHTVNRATVKGAK